jgi:hypothetical protein
MGHFIPEIFQVKTNSLKKKMLPFTSCTTSFSFTPQLFKVASSKENHFFTKPWYRHGLALEGAPTANTYMNERAVRGRGGCLLLLAFTALAHLYLAPERKFIIYAGPFVIWDMFSGVVFGLTPLTPFGVLGTILTWHLPPSWGPARPKKLAWAMGVGLSGSCWLARIFLGPHPAVYVMLMMCVVLTWMESTLGI